jgi:hypothetical protein
MQIFGKLRMQVFQGGKPLCRYAASPQKGRKFCSI